MSEDKSLADQIIGSDIFKWLQIGAVAGGAYSAWMKICEWADEAMKKDDLKEAVKKWLDDNDQTYTAQQLNDLTNFMWDNRDELTD